MVKGREANLSGARETNRFCAAVCVCVFSLSGSSLSKLGGMPVSGVRDVHTSHHLLKKKSADIFFAWCVSVRTLARARARVRACARARVCVCVCVCV